jgi:hypothetical protein
MGIETKEHIDALFNGEESLSEEFKDQAKAIFEAAVQTKVDEHKAQLEEQMAEDLEQKSQELTEALVSKIDDYLDYVVSEWMEENRVAIEGGLKAEIAEDFMVGLKNLFSEHYIDIPEEKVDVVEGMAEQVQTLQQDLDNAISERAELIDQLNTYKKQQIAFEVSESLSEVQMAKLQSLAEHIEFVSESDYKEKLLLTKKKYFESKESEDSVVDSQSSLDSEESLDESFSPVMSRYVQSISRNVKK